MTVGMTKIGSDISLVGGGGCAVFPAALTDGKLILGSRPRLRNAKGYATEPGMPRFWLDMGKPGRGNGIMKQSKRSCDVFQR